MRFYCNNLAISDEHIRWRGTHSVPYATSLSSMYCETFTGLKALRIQ